MKDQMKIALNIVAKNEGKTIYETISRVNKIADVVYLAIDGATNDNTLEQAKKACYDHGIKFVFYMFEWRDDFSLIRNDLISRTPDEYSHILILDGHDFITEKSIELLQLIKSQVGIDEVFVYDFLVFQNTETGRSKWQQPRFIRNNGKIYYENAIHNTITYQEKRYFVKEVEILHAQPIERLNARKEQRKTINVEKFKKALISNPKDSRSAFYLANAYYEMEQWEKAADCYENYLAISTFNSERYQAKLWLSNCFRKLDYADDFEIKTLVSCFEENTGRNEHIFILGNIFMQKQDFQSALSFYKMAATFEEPSSYFMLSEEYYTWMPYIKIAMAYIGLEDAENAIAAINKGRTFGPDIKAFIEIEQKIKDKFKEVEKNKNGWIYFAVSNPSFLVDIIEACHEKYLIRVEESFNPVNAGIFSAKDIIWCEWADKNAIAVANYKTKAKKILRIHSYEIYQRDLDQINFNAFDTIIFVAEHIKNQFLDRFKNIDAEIKVIPNSIDLSKFSIDKKAKEQTQKYKIAWAGYGSNKKGLALLKFLANTKSNIEFHLAVQWQQQDIRLFMEHDLPGNMFLHPWQKDLNHFFKDKHFVISTSPRESQHLTVMEGMAAGCYPLVYNWPGAEEIYGEENLFDSIEDFDRLFSHAINDRHWTGNRQLVLKYDKKIIVKNIIDLIVNLKEK